MDINDVPALLRDDVQAEEVIMEQYDRQPQVWRQFTSVRDLSQTNHYGKIGTVMQGAGDFEERADGAEVQADQPGQGPSWYARVRQFSRRIDLPYRMAEGMTAGQVGDWFNEKLDGFGQRAALRKRQLVAGMFNTGMLTAGSQEYFDGRHPNGVDPYPKFVYDGLPFFDTAHTLSGSASTISNHTASLALSATNLETVLTAFQTTMNKDERGSDIQLDPKYLLVPPALEGTANRIINSELIPGSTSNDTNYLRGKLQVIPWAGLTNAAGWYVSTGKGVDVFDGALQTALARDEIKRQWSLVVEFHVAPVVTDIRGTYCANVAAS